MNRSSLKDTLVLAAVFVGAVTLLATPVAIATSSIPMGLKLSLVLNIVLLAVATLQRLHIANRKSAVQTVRSVAQHWEGAYASQEEHVRWLSDCLRRSNAREAELRTQLRALIPTETTK